MFKRRFRLPSPALVISMITLSLVLGGTAFAASTATHKDKKADTKLIKKLAPSLSVKHAKTADSATHATSARQRDERDERDQRHERNQRDERDQRDQRDQCDELGMSPSDLLRSGDAAKQDRRSPWTYAAAARAPRAAATSARRRRRSRCGLPLTLAGLRARRSSAEWHERTATHCPGVGQADRRLALRLRGRCTASATCEQRTRRYSTHVGFGGFDTYGFIDRIFSRDQLVAHGRGHGTSPHRPQLKKQPARHANGVRSPCSDACEGRDGPRPGERSDQARRQRVGSL